jgi:hypothetical protein
MTPSLSLALFAVGCWWLLLAHPWCFLYTVIAVWSITVVVGWTFLVVDAVRRRRVKRDWPVAHVVDERWN